LRSVIRVLDSLSGCQVWVVSIGNGPCAVRITSRCGPHASALRVYAPGTVVVSAVTRTACGARAAGPDCIGMVGRHRRHNGNAE
jgi:hypothetical protein